MESDGNRSLISSTSADRELVQLSSPAGSASEKLHNDMQQTPFIDGTSNSSPVRSSSRSSRQDICGQSNLAMDAITPVDDKTVLDNQTGGDSSKESAFTYYVRQNWMYNYM